MWHLHQRQEEMFAPAVGPSEVDLVLPRLLRGVRRRVPSADAGAPSVKEAEAALRAAEAAAAAAALDAAEQAAAAGLDYVPPPGVAVDLSGVARTDTRPLEEQAAALERRAAQRAAAAQLAADRGVQRAAAQRAAAERAAAERAAAERAERSARPAAGRQADAGSLAADSAAARRRAAVQRGAPERCAAERHPARAAASGAASPPGLKGMDAWAAAEPFQASHAHAAAHASSRTASGMGAGTPARAGSARGRSGQAAAARQQDAGAAFAPGRAGLEGDGGGGRARARAPKARLRLCLQDVGPALVGARLQVLWPEDGRWWPGTVTALNARGRSATLLYETGEEELGLDLEALARRGEVAWADADDAPRAKRPPSAPPPAKGGAGAGRKRKDAPAGTPRRGGPTSAAEPWASPPLADAPYADPPLYSLHSGRSMARAGGRTCNAWETRSGDGGGGAGGGNGCAKAQQGGLHAAGGGGRGARDPSLECDPALALRAPAGGRPAAGYPELQPGLAQFLDLPDDPALFPILLGPDLGFNWT